MAFVDLRNDTLAYKDRVMGNFDALLDGTATFTALNVTGNPAITGNPTVTGDTVLDGDVSTTQTDNTGSSSSSTTLADDAATSVNLGADAAGIVLVWTVNGTVANEFALVAFDAFGGSQATHLISGGSSIEVTTGVLAGTTGTDGKFTISAAASGVLYFENRLNGSRTFGYKVLGSK